MCLKSRAQPPPTTTHKKFPCPVIGGPKVPEGMSLRAGGKELGKACNALENFEKQISMSGRQGGNELEDHRKRKPTITESTLRQNKSYCNWNHRALVTQCAVFTLTMMQKQSNSLNTVCSLTKLGKQRC